MEVSSAAWARLTDGPPHFEVMDRIARALQTKYGPEEARDIAFNASDWIRDAAALVELHLEPEKFSDEEVREIIERQAIHTCHHVMALTHLWGGPLRDMFDLGLEIEKP